MGGTGTRGSNTGGSNTGGSNTGGSNTGESSTRESSTRESRTREASAGRSSAGRSARSTTVVRGAVSAAAVVLLIGAALAAGGVGPWVARPLTSPPREPPPFRTPPTLTAPSRPTSAQQGQDEGSGVFGWAIRLVVIAVIAAVAIWVIWLVIGKIRDVAGERRPIDNSGDRPPELSMGREPPPLRAEASGRDFDPRAAADAIISCWLWVETAAAARGLGRRSQDTPTEFLAHLLEAHPEADPVRPAAAVLLPLYQRARFDHVALTQDAAVRAREAAGVLCGRSAADPAEHPAEDAGARPAPRVTG